MGVEEHGHRAAITELYLHHAAEPAGLDRRAEIPASGREVVAELLRPLRLHGGGEGGASPLTAIAQQGELADHQQRPVHVEERTVHVLMIILEDAEVYDLGRHRLHIFICVPVLHAEEHGQAGADLGDGLLVDSDPGPAHPLNNGAHDR